MANADLKWVATAIMSGFLRRQLADPDRIAQWVDAVTDVLTAAAARPTNDPQFAQILATLQRIETMSETQQSSNAALTAAVGTLSTDMTQFASDLTAGLAQLKAQIASGQTPDFTAVDAATTAINSIDAGLKTASDGLKAALAPPVVVPPAGGGVVFNSADPTPNAPGGRNSSQLPGFDATLPETA